MQLEAVAHRSQSTAVLIRFSYGFSPKAFEFPEGAYYASISSGQTTICFVLLIHGAGLKERVKYQFWMSLHVHGRKSCNFFKESS